MEKSKSSNRIVTICFLGLMAALCMVSNYLQIRLPIGGDAGTRIHFANAFCLLAGYLFGGVGGGLAAGIGASIFDLTDPVFAPEFYITFVFKFAMAFLCGLIAWSGGAQGRRFWRNVAAGVTGSLVYVALYLAKTYVVKFFIEKNDPATVWTVMLPKAATSLGNAAIAVVIAVPLAAALRRAFDSMNFDRYLTFGSRK